MYKNLLISLVLATVTMTAFSQGNALKSININDIKRQMKYLSSDSLQGRKTGSEGNIKAADFIAAEAASVGLKPVPGQESMYQQLSFQKISVKPDSTYIVVRDTTGRITAQGSITPFMVPSSDVSLTGDVVFAGYGYINSRQNYNDLHGIQINNKIIIVMTRKPDIAGSGMPGAAEEVSEDMELRKLSSLLIMNPKAVLFVADPGYGKPVEPSFTSAETYKLVPLFKTRSWDFQVNVGIISESTANAILKQAGQSLESLQKKIAETKAPASFVVPGVKGVVKVSVKKDTIESPNIIAFMEGSDSVLKKECVIYSAHYDHVGVDASGDVFNGANDNASGSVGLLSVAKAFSSLHDKPSRSIVFLWTTGEEEGLYGSNYYTSNPLFPLDKTVADINFDMIGRSRMAADTGKVRGEKLDITGPDSIRLVSARDCREFIRIATDAGKENKLVVIDEGKGLHFTGSDHYPFTVKGIPAVFFFTGLHRDYHKETDEYRFIDFNKMLKVAQTGFLTGYRIANRPERIVFDAPNSK